MNVIVGSNDEKRGRASPQPFDDAKLGPSGNLLDAGIALDEALHRHAISKIGLDAYTADLLVRLMTSPGRQLRGVDIARRLLITTSRTTRLIDRAEAAGLVERQKDPDDRRAQRIVLTGRGERMALSYWPHLERVLDRVIFDTFTDTELRTLMKLLARLRDAARNVAESDDFASG